MLKSDAIADRLENKSESDDPLMITPQPNLDDLRRKGAASVDLRLGCWFLTLRQSRYPVLKIGPRERNDPGENRLTRKYYVPFGGEYILHPRHFVLGVTMEWLRIPHDMGGYVVGKSSWGRRGLVIATAIGVHPGFCGCLTLEITNLGELPVVIQPGILICQLFLHKTGSDSQHQDQTSFLGHRRPALGIVDIDDIAQRLMSDQK